MRPSVQWLAVWFGGKGEGEVGGVMGDGGWGGAVWGGGGEEALINSFCYGDKGICQTSVTHFQLQAKRDKERHRHRQKDGVRHRDTDIDRKTE